MAIRRTESSKRPTRRVALAFPVRLAHLHTIVRGIVDYAQEHGPWVFTTSGEAHDLPVRALTRWQGDGIISTLDSEAEAEAARSLRIPVVTFVGVVRNPGIPRVMMDQEAIGRLAAEHLLARGFRRFGFYGVDGAGYSAMREGAFIARLAAENATVNRYLSPNMLDHKQPWDDEIDALCRWLRKMPVPVGIFAANDARARMIADACALVGRKVPEEVGVIGVDNSQLDCEFGSPKLTSIECDWWAVGYHAAKLLDGLMAGHAPPKHDQLIPPTGVIPRESTDVTIVEHPAVARAVAYTRAHLDKSFGVKALVNAAGVSRRYLETSFLESLHRTPGEYLAEMRVERAKELLLSKGMTLSRVARACGFSDLRQFRRVFMRVQKMTPRQYRIANKEHLREAKPRRLA
jgi:LacI family transcriptional regulator